MNHLLKTKFFAPPPENDLVSRPRLTEFLNDGINRGHRLFLISAPAGYGKSTLIVQWLNQTSRPFVWLSLDGEDNNLQRFLTYFIAALKQLNPDIGEATISLLASPQLPTVNTLMTPLINDIAAAAQPFFLILDDYQFINEATIHEAMTLLLNHQPTQIQLVLATRVEPPLSLPRLRLRGQLTELRSDDLRFTQNETNSFFRQAQLNLNPEAVHLLSERTEGWVAGLQMTVLSVQGWDETRINEFITAFSGSNHYIIDYLVDEVLRRQTEEVRDFLSQTAILDRLSAPLCDAVTGRSDSRHILSQLERSNLFVIPLDQQREWFRFHQLFADAVRVELEINSEQRLLLHQRAARWFEEHNLLPGAIKHALAAQDWLEAGRLTILVADQFLNNLELGTLESWLTRLPETIVFSNPELAILKGWVSFFTGQPTTSKVITRILNDLSPERISQRSWSRLVSLRATLATIQEASEAVDLLQEALTLMGEDDTLFRQLNLVTLGLAQRLLGQTIAATDSYREAIDLGRLLRVPFYTIHAIHELAFTLIERGRPRDVLTLCQQARQEWGDARGQPFPATDLLDIPLAAVAYECNDLIQARTLALQGREAQRRLGQELLIGLECEQILILASAGLGDWDEAQGLIRQDIQLDHTWNWFVPHIAMLEATIQLRRGEVEAARRWADKVQLGFNEKPDELRETWYFTYVRVLLAREDYQEAQRILSELEIQVQNGGRYARLITVRILQALAAAALANPETANQLLAEAVQLAAPVNYLRRFLDEGPMVANLVPSVRFVAPSFVDNIIRAFSRTESYPAVTVTTPPDSPNSLLPESLTRQELKVLRLLNEGLSSEDVAKRLVISESTVKWHIHNIYDKFEVNKRSEAIKKARESGLL